MDLLLSFIISVGSQIELPVRIASWPLVHYHTTSHLLLEALEHVSSRIRTDRSRHIAWVCVLPVEILGSLSRDNTQQLNKVKVRKDDIMYNYVVQCNIGMQRHASVQYTTARVCSMSSIVVGM